jgi:hypothetical protein
MEYVRFAPARRALTRAGRNRASVQLIAIAALVVSLAVAVTAVSIGFARAGSAIVLVP